MENPYQSPEEIILDNHRTETNPDIISFYYDEKVIQKRNLFVFLMSVVGCILQAVFILPVFGVTGVQFYLITAVYTLVLSPLVTLFVYYVSGLYICKNEPAIKISKEFIQVLALQYEWNEIKSIRRRKNQLEITLNNHFTSPINIAGSFLKQSSIDDVAEAITKISGVEIG